MSCFTFAQAGGPEVLSFVEAEPAAPGPGEVRIAVKAIGINRAEAMWRNDDSIDPGRFPAADATAFRQRVEFAREKTWVVYATPPFAAPAAVLAYLSRYTHRVAISIHLHIAALLRSATPLAFGAARAVRNGSCFSSNSGTFDK